MTYTEITPELTRSDDLAVGVHCRGRAGATEGAELDHPACRRRGEGKTLATGLVAPADNLATVVHGQGPAVSATGEGAEIDHPACRRPGEGMTINTKSVTHADDLAVGIDCQGPAPRAAEGAGIDHPARRRPREGMGPEDRKGTGADDLATVVHGPRSEERRVGKEWGHRRSRQRMRR